MTGHDPAVSVHHSDTPVALPCIIASQTADDELTVVYRDDTAARGDHSRDETTVAPADLGTLIVGYAERAGVPVRVEIHAPDGTVYADIVRPPARPTAPLAAEESADEPAAKTVEQGGFLPGETVLVARVVAKQRADTTGRVAGNHESAAVAEAGEVLLVGTVSHLAVARSWP